MEQKAIVSPSVDWTMLRSCSHVCMNISTHFDTASTPSVNEVQLNHALKGHCITGTVVFKTIAMKSNLLEFPKGAGRL